MKTQFLNHSSIHQAAKLLHRGQTVVFPTETVYGLGANAFSESAVRRIFLAKGRPSNNPLIVHVASVEMALTAAREVNPLARTLMERFWPGPLTLILPRSPELAPSVTAGLPTVGLRWPRHELCQQLLELCGFPVAAPSANRSGRPSPTSFQAARQEMDGRVAAILRGPDCQLGLESTVVGFDADRVVMYRPGAVTREDLEAVLNTPVTLAQLGSVAASPGMLHRHYQPACPVHLYEELREVAAGPQDWIISPVSAQADGPGRRVLVDGLEDYARRLYHLFLEAEAAGASGIWCWLPPEGGLGQALRDRLLRAAGFQPGT